ncbi:MAG: hypothetical protein Q4D34_07765 [Eggerthellaceae bacterium]|nr:hypothetical protein [Eggerthellaceae bacterium]
MTDREWDKRLHIHTIGREDEANPHYSPYEPTPYSVLERLASSGHIHRKSHLLDYGCGKGRVVFFMASTIGCRDLFNGKDERERIELYRLRNIESIG